MIKLNYLIIFVFIITFSNQCGFSSEKGIEKLKNEAIQGNVEAQKHLYAIYYKGIGVQVDYSEAYKWLKMASDANDDVALCAMGRLYFIGHGVDQDYNEAFKYFLKSAQLNNEFAQLSIILFYIDGLGVEKNNIEAIKWLLIAKNNGSEKADQRINELLKEKIITVDELEKAKKELNQNDRK